LVVIAAGSMLAVRDRVAAASGYVPTPRRAVGRGQAGDFRAVAMANVLHQSGL